MTPPGILSFNRLATTIIPKWLHTRNNNLEGSAEWPPDKKLVSALRGTRVGCLSGTLGYRAVFGKPIESDLRILSGADLVVFQDGSELEPPFSNQRVQEYEQYLQKMGSTSNRIIADLYGYRVPHPNKTSPRRNSKFLYHSD